MLLVCKECYEKKYGKLSDIVFYESDQEGVCIICSKKKRLIKRRFPPKKENYMFFD